MLRIRPIVLGASIGFAVAFFTFFLFGIFERGSLAFRVFQGIHRPETALVEYLTETFYPNKADRGLVFVVPVHFGYWMMLGIASAAIYLVARSRHRQTPKP